MTARDVAVRTANARATSPVGDIDVRAGQLFLIKQPVPESALATVARDEELELRLRRSLAVRSPAECHHHAHGQRGGAVGDAVSGQVIDGLTDGVTSRPDAVGGAVVLTGIVCEIVESVTWRCGHCRRHR